MQVRYIGLLLLWLYGGCTFGAGRLDSLLTVLDETIASGIMYADRHEKQIEVLRKQLARSSLSFPEKYRLNEALYEAYRAYMCDSAIHYLNLNIELSARAGDGLRESRSRISQSYLLSSAGMYMEAVDVLEGINGSGLDTSLLVPYYAACDHVYGELGYYTQDKRGGAVYLEKARQYKDSIFRMADPHQETFQLIKETQLRDADKFEEAVQVNNERLARVVPDTPEYAVVMYHRALIYRDMGDKERYMMCLARSSVADIRSAIKDHASLWMLAQALFDRGDLERAYRYMNFSWQETKQYNARLRAWQSVDDLSLIDNTYRVMLQERNRQLKLYIGFSSFLSVVILCALFYIFRQVKKLRLARRKLLEANNELNRLNEELKEMNLCLQSANKELVESNAIKEEYIARFIKLCSTYVDRLDAYRRMVQKKLHANQAGELLRLTRQNDVLEEALNELYANFDSAFLHLFPRFVEQFNELLQENEQIVLKHGEQLNTELRIFALIRLGITDSSQIAEFLHYSVNTIYNYRAKVKNKAKVQRENFEELVCRIG